jgi:type IV pilus assembly protein PilC
MPFYKCIFVDIKGQTSVRTLFADSKEDLHNLYADSERKLVRIKRHFLKNMAQTRIFSAKVGLMEFLIFNQKMRTLLRSGVSFLKGLEISILNMKKGSLQEILIKAESDIKNGLQISAAFSSQALPYHQIYQAALLAGEKSGNLEQILGKFNDYLEKVTYLRKRVKSSLAYPVVLLIFMVMLVFLILIFAIPKFTAFYQGFEAKLPVITLKLVSVSMFFKDYFHWLLAMIFIIYGIIRIIEKMNNQAVIIDYLKIKLPFIGTIIRENALSVFSRTIAILLSGGIPVPESVAVSIHTFSNKYMLNQVNQLPGMIKEGQLLSQSMANLPMIPGMMRELVKVGESSGNLVEVMNNNAAFYEESINYKVNSFISLIEPILIVILGLVIAFMLIAIYLPIFNLVNVIDSAQMIENY